MKDIEQWLLDNIADYRTPDPGWQRINLPNVLNDTGAKDFKIEPPDAKTPEEVKFFTISYEVKGYRVIKFKRKHS